MANIISLLIVNPSRNSWLSYLFEKFQVLVGSMSECSSLSASRYVGKYLGLYLLSDHGIQNCGDIYTHRVNLALLDKEFGLRFMLQTYLGLASNVVRPTQREETKSIGVERSVSVPSPIETVLIYST